MPGGVPARAIADRRVIERLMRACAFAPDTSQPLPDLRWIEGRALRRLTEKGVIREHASGRYYLDGAALADHYASRRMRLAIALLLVIGLMMTLALFAAKTATVQLFVPR